MNSNPSNAYLLFYERKNFYNEKNEQINNLYTGLDDLFYMKKKQRKNEILRKVYTENIEYSTVNYYFEQYKQFPKFIVKSLIHLRHKLQGRMKRNKESRTTKTFLNEYEIIFVQTAIMFFMMVNLRRKVKQ